MQTLLYQWRTISYMSSLLYQWTTILYAIFIMPMEDYFIYAIFIIIPMEVYFIYTIFIMLMEDFFYICILYYAIGGLFHISHFIMPEEVCFIYAIFIMPMGGCFILLKAWVNWQFLSHWNKQDLKLIAFYCYYCLVANKKEKCLSDHRDNKWLFLLWLTIL